jgi:LPS-assembly protein
MRVLAIAFAAYAAFAVVGSPVWSQQGPDEGVLLEADDVTYDTERSIVSAAGNVEIVSSGRILQADVLRYDQETDVVTASGNVSLLERDGTVLFADELELSDQLKNGSIAGFKALLSDDSRFAAASAARADGNITVMRRAVYTNNKSPIPTLASKCLVSRYCTPPIFPTPTQRLIAKAGSSYLPNLRAHS